jgi:hypothetical protein
MELTMMITEQELKKIILEELSKKRKKRKKNISAPPGAPGGGKSFDLNIIVLKEPKYDSRDPNRFEPFEKYWKRTGMGEPVEGAIKITNVQIEEMMDLKSDIKEPELAQKYKEALSYLIYDNGKREEMLCR